MFVIFATKPLTDRTKGFRFNVLGMKGIVRLRKNKSNGWFKRAGGTEMSGMHFGKLTVYRERPANRANAGRKLRHFAG
jgi:hypothetical protein